MTTNQNNPWMESHIEGEQAYGDSRAEAEAAVAAEYLGTEPPRPCPTCNGQLWWRATVGAMICPTCGRMESSGGHKVYKAGAL